MSSFGSGVCLSLFRHGTDPSDEAEMEPPLSVFELYVLECVSSCFNSRIPQKRLNPVSSPLQKRPFQDCVSDRRIQAEDVLAHYEATASSHYLDVSMKDTVDFLTSNSSLWTGERVCDTANAQDMQ
ncbi:unnamed protein product [Leuciscus chuanchicus]